MISWPRTVFAIMSGLPITLDELFALKTISSENVKYFTKKFYGYFTSGAILFHLISYEIGYCLSTGHCGSIACQAVIEHTTHTETSKGACSLRVPSVTSIVNQHQCRLNHIRQRRVTIWDRPINQHTGHSLTDATRGRVHVDD